MKTLLAAVAALACGAAAAQAGPTPSRQMIETCGATNNEACIIRQFKDTPEASMRRGRIVFENYCVLCHGAQGLGNGRAAKLHSPPPANLVASRVPPEYLALIIRRGGEALGRGKGMPPRDDQLTDEQVRDVVTHLMVVASEVRSLAKRSQQAALDIQALVQSAIAEVDAGARLSQTAQASMTQVVGASQELMQLLTQAASGSIEHAQSPRASVAPLLEHWAPTCAATAMWWWNSASRCGPSRAGRWACWSPSVASRRWLRLWPDRAQGPLLRGARLGKAVNRGMRS